MTEPAPYFQSRASGRAEGLVGTFGRIDAQPVITAAPGVRLQPLAGDRVLLSRVTFEPHSEAPVHTHDEEQMGMVLSGWIDFDLDGEVRRLVPGDLYHAPPGVPHGARTGEERCIVLDVFSPPRAALVALLQEAAGEPGR